MAKYNVHGGHNKIVQGASGYLNEVTEDRKVKNAIIKYLKSMGHTVYDCTDDAGKTQSKNLSNIVAKCNAHSGITLDISIHLNAGGGTGVEVLYTSSKGKSYAEKVSKSISSTLGLKNRGAKERDNLYVLNHTNATAILVECCFVDNKTDKEKWNVDKCAKAIVEAVTGKTVSSSSTTPNTTNSTTTSTTTTTNTTSSQKSVNYKVKINTASGVNMRSGAGTSYGVVTAIPNNVTVTITKESGSWGYTTYNNKKGWISLNYTKKVSTTTSSKITKTQIITNLQENCNDQGFSNQKVDGIEGTNTLDGCPTLRKGASGEITRCMQQLLVYVHGYSISCDGKFGSDTEQCVKKFQKAKGLTVDGVVGKNTWRELLGL